jgi:hypothetical protein
LGELLQELAAYPAPYAVRPPTPPAPHDSVVVPLRLVTDAGVLAFFSTTTVFGTPVDVTLSELALESFYPADPATADALRRLADAQG